MLARLAKGLLVVALIISIGAHWAILQSVAWAGMLYTYSQQATFSRAVELTFSGDRPCSLCKAIEDGKAQERETEQETIQPSKDFKLAMLSVRFLLQAPVVQSPELDPEIFLSCAPAQPDAPPPRVASS